MMGLNQSNPIPYNVYAKRQKLIHALVVLVCVLLMVIIINSLVAEGELRVGTRVIGKIDYTIKVNGRGDRVRFSIVGNRRLFSLAGTVSAKDKQDKGNGVTERLESSRGLNEWMIEHLNKKDVILVIQGEAKGGVGGTPVFMYLADGTFVNELLIKNGLADVDSRAVGKLNHWFTRVKYRAKR